jgi:hypothetical protein
LPIGPFHKIVNLFKKTWLSVPVIVSPGNGGQVSPHNGPEQIGPSWDFSDYLSSFAPLPVWDHAHPSLAA